MTRSRKQRIFGVLLLTVASAVLAAASRASAVQILLTPASAIGGSGAYSSDPFTDPPSGQFAAGNVADNQLAGAIPEPNQSAGDAEGGYWLGKQGDAAEYFVLDLGAVFSITQIDLFNTHNASFNDRATNGFEIFASNEIAPATICETGAGTCGFDLVNAVQIASGNLARQVFADDPIEPESVFPNISPDEGFRYLRFNTVGPFHPESTQGVGLNEFQVFGITPIPEPSSLSLLTLGIVAWTRWRRKTSPAQKPSGEHQDHHLC